jgi:uncharacterized membrane protein
MDDLAVLLMLVGVAVLVLLIGGVLGFVAYSRVQRLERDLLARINRLELQLHGTPPPAPAPPPQASEYVPAEYLIPIPPDTVAPGRADAAGTRSDLESVIAGRWLNRVGLLLVFFAAFFALKWEFDNDVLGPAGRVALWTVLGAGMMAFSQWLLGKGYKYLSEGLTGLGGAVLYLTLYFAWEYYRLFPQMLAFVAMIMVTAALLAIAVGRDSQRIALFALIGGFLTPLLTSSGRDAQVVLFSYLLVLDTGLLVLARAREWRGLEPLAFAGTTAFYWGWYARFYDVSEPLARTALFATLFYAVFTALPIVRSRATSRIFPEQVIQVPLNAGNYLLALHAMLWPDQRWTLTGIVLALAAVHMVMTRIVPPLPSGRPVARMLFAGLGLTFVALAIPIRLEGQWVAIGWAVEGTVLVWTGFLARWRFLRGAGITLFGVAVFHLLTSSLDAHTFLLNARFATFAAIIACLALAIFWWTRHRDQVEGNERTAFGALAVAVNVLAVWALSLEVNQYFEPALATDFVEPGAATLRRTADLSRQVTLSLLWTIYATILVVTGVRQGLAAVRWQGLVLFGIVVVKVFTLDMSFLSGGHRVLSSIVLGIVLIAVSVLYQRRLATQAAVPRP